MAGIYRKASLDRLASPEQLDKLIKVTSPMVWISTAGIILVLIVVIAWAFLGTLPEKVEVNGIYTNNAETQGKFAASNGKITVLVAKDDAVKKGQLLAKIDGTDIEKGKAEIQKNIADITKITLESVNDPSSSQTSSLLEIKSKYESLGLSAEQYAYQLSQLNKQLATQKSAVSSYKKKYKAAEDDYLECLGDDTYNKLYFDYQTASTTYENASKVYSSAATAVGNAQTAYNTAFSTYGASDPRTVAAGQALAAAQTNAVNAQSALVKAEATFKSTLAKYESAYKKQNANSAKKQKYYDIYTEAGSLYSNACTAQASIESSIANLKMQKGSDAVGTEDQRASLESQFDKTKEAMLTELNTQLQKQEESEANLEIKADADGVVTEIAVQNNQLIAAGTEVIKVKSQDSKDMIVVCYVPLTDAKKLEPGMKVTVTPSTVKEEEYGHMNGKVKTIGEYNATTLEMRKTLGDDLMVSAMQQQGPSVEVRIALNPDPESVNGYEWSNKKGSEITLSQGTVIQANVITAQKAPITKLLPYLQDQLKLKTDSAN